MADRKDGTPIMELRTAPAHKALDAWIAADLARRYESALAEPLPADLLALLRE